MKLLMLLMIAFCLCSCHHATEPNKNTSALSITFLLTDINGQRTTQAHSGESFLLSCTITNNTPDTIVYRSGIPLISFTISKDDSLYASSYFGCPIPKVSDILFAGQLPPNQTLRYGWRAPTPVCQNMMTTLVPGTYQAYVFFPTFDGVNVASVAPISFTIIP
jgi:hypothetical protein